MGIDQGRGSGSILQRDLKIVRQRWCGDQPPAVFRVTAEEAIAATGDIPAPPKTEENK
jgi:hypothetical protein